MLPATGALGLPRGARVRIRLGEIDEITLDITSAVIERLDAVDADVAATGRSAESAHQDDGDDDGESDMAAGPISIAVDVNEPAADAVAASEPS